MEAEQQLNARIAVKNAERDEVTQDLTDRKYKVEEQTQKIHDLQEDADRAEKRAALAEEVRDCFKDTSASEREKEYFERILDLTYENGKLKAENRELKEENSRLRDRLQQTYDFMKKYAMNGINMLGMFLRSIGEWVQQKVAGRSR